MGYTEIFAVVLFAVALAVLAKALKRLFNRKKEPTKTLPAGEYRTSGGNAITVALAGYLTWMRWTGHMAAYVSYDYIYKGDTLILSRPDEVVEYPLILTDGGFILDGKEYVRQVPSNVLSEETTETL